MHNLFFKFCTGIFFWKYIPQLWWKRVLVLCLWVSGIFPKFPFSVFTHQKSSRIFKEFFCRPKGECVKLIFYLQYPSNTPTYNTSDPYLIQNNLILDVPFCMHNNLKTIIKIYCTIKISFVLLFPSVPSYWNHESWVHKTRNFVYDRGEIGSTYNRHLSKIIRPLRTIFNLLRFYTSSLNVL